MKYADLVAKIDGLDVEEKDEILDGLKSFKSTLDQENRSLRSKRNDIESKYNSVLGDLKEFGYDGGDIPVGDFIKTKINQGGGSDGDALKEEVKLIRQKLEDAEKRASESTAKAQRSTIQSKLSDALRGKLLGHNNIVENVILSGKAKVRDGTDSEVIFVNGDDVMDFDAGIKSIIDNNRELLVSAQNGGSGGQGGSGGSGVKKMTESDFRKMDPRERATFMADGGELTD